MSPRHWKLPRKGGNGRRMWYAEDVAAAMEMLEDGCEPWAIAIAYGCSAERLQHALSRARKHGFDAFPLRANARVPRRLLKPPAVSGDAARRFLEQRTLTA